ncbi:hypothetical protein RD055328_08680 [Companilactobacillus sp. RD055328]|uniref:siphovirus Gp157 family protein n=1 Tax=Companilactobacillus sp. RD055328 TaxID=2916634 RepID=UPI001FC8D796|nr:siphovirus Gp157 family protein [Companilactobacillus sp. RD055328]GKQ42945.1 hypothetical protein RD055328_08680 [Companilactobacillus sp. RD055328]
MTSLYDLTDDYRRLLDYAEDMDPTLFHDTLDSIDVAIEDKAENYAKVDKELGNSVVNIKEEISRLKSKADSITRNRTNLKNNLFDSMKKVGKEKIKTDLFTISIRKSPAAVQIDNEESIPPIYFETKQTVSKTKIKEVLKKGGVVPGTHLESSESVQIR